LSNLSVDAEEAQFVALINDNRSIARLLKQQRRCTTVETGLLVSLTLDTNNRRAVRWICIE
jgi:hypothetical protein